MPMSPRLLRPRATAARFAALLTVAVFVLPLRVR